MLSLVWVLPSAHTQALSPGFARLDALLATADETDGYLAPADRCQGARVRGLGDRSGQLGFRVQGFAQGCDQGSGKVAGEPMRRTATSRMQPDARGATFDFKFSWFNWQPGSPTAGRVAGREDGSLRPSHMGGGTISRARVAAVARTRSCSLQMRRSARHGSQGGGRAPLLG